MVRIEFFGIVRARAGCESCELEGATVRVALSNLAQRVPALVPDVVAANGELAAGYLLSRNGARFRSDGEEALEHGDTLLLMGAQAGG